MPSCHAPADASQEAVRKLHEAQAALEKVQKAAAAQEADQAAAEALHPWPADARLVPANQPRYLPARPQTLHPDVAALGSYLASLPGGIGPARAAALGTSSRSVESDAAAPDDAGDAASLGSDRQTSNAGVCTTPAVTTQQWGLPDPASAKVDSREPGCEGHLSGWQLRLQSGIPQQQLQQVCAQL